MNKRFFILVSFFQLFFIPFCFSEQAGFYSLNDRWERAQGTGKTKSEALDEGFKLALSQGGSGDIDSQIPPTITRTLAQIVQSGNVIELQIKQSLIIVENDIIKFISTEEGVVTLETTSDRTLRVLGAQVGRTYVHVWTPAGRTTFELQVIPQKFSLTSSQLRQLEAAEKSRPFQLGYSHSRSAFYNGDKFRENRRSTVDFTQNLTLTGDTPYGAFASKAQTQKARSKMLLTEAQVSLKDGHIGRLKNFDTALGDSDVGTPFFIFPQARVRGAVLEHSDDKGRVKWKGFHGRENIGVTGTLAPGLFTKRTRNSYLSGGILDFQLNENANMKTGYFFGSGKTRPDNLNRKGIGEQLDFKLGPHVRFTPQASFDDQKWAQKYDVKVDFEKLHLKTQFRDVSNEFVSMIGLPPHAGEVGVLTDLNMDPFQNVNLSGSLDIFRDRLIPNPADVRSVNIHSDLALRIIPTETSSLLLTFQDLDDTGRVSPTRQRAFGAQYNRLINVLGHKGTLFARYENRGNRVLNNSSLNYVRDQVIAGIHTDLFWGIHFSLQQEWSGLGEPNIDQFTQPRALIYTFDYSGQMGHTPFFMDTSLRIRDEEETESSNSFMSGEDSAELSVGIYYREYDNMEIFLTGSVQDFVRESRNVVSSQRVEAQFLTGMRYNLDTHVSWTAVGSFDGFVFKDLDGDGLREPGEPGIEGMIVKSADGKEAVTDKRGFYELKSVSGKKAILTLDSVKLPYGFIPTTSARQEVPIEQSKTVQVDFGLAPRSEISGVIFNDLNGNGKYDLSDIGVRKVKVTLETGAVAKSSGLGEYSFPNVVAGEHTVSLDLASLPDGYVPLDVPKKTVTVYEGIRYELQIPLRASRAVTGRVFLDANRNGAMESNEQPVSGVKVLLGTKEVLSDKDGYYLFDELNSGVYALSVDPSTLPPGMEPLPESRVDLPNEPTTIKNKDIPVVKKNGEL